jgi:O-antigen/teichoic acid export membrane protein
MFKNILHSVFTKGVVAIINFFILILSSHYLGVSSRGEISIFILNITIIQIINEVYTGYSLVYFIPKYNLKKIFVTGIIYTLSFCTLSNAIIVFLNKQVQGFEWLGYLVSLLIILNTFNCVLILGKELVKIYNFLNFLQPFLLLAGLAIYIFTFKEVTFVAYVFPLLISFLIAFIISSWVVFKFTLKNKTLQTFELKPILINGIVCQAGVLMYILGNRYSFYLLPDSAKVGLYSSASSLIESVLIISNGISPVLLARVANQGNTIKSSEITMSLTKASVLFSALAIFVIFLLPESFFVFLLGSGFTGIKHLMMLYAPGILMISFFGIISNYFSAIGKLKLVLLCNSFGFMTTLIIAPILIKNYSIEGAAYTANITYFIIASAIYIAFFVTNKLSFKRLFSFSQDYKNLKELIIKKGE